MEVLVEPPVYRAVPIGRHRGRRIIRTWPPSIKMLIQKFSAGSSCTIIAAQRLAMQLKAPRDVALARVVVTEWQGRGAVFAPMHWTDQFASAARVNRLVAAHTDPVSGQPESKYTPVSVRRFDAEWHGFAVTRMRPKLVAADYWAVGRTDAGGVRLELAGIGRIDDWDKFANRLLGAADGQSISRIAYHDRAAGTYRFAQFEAAVCVGQLYIARVPVEVSRTWASEQFGKSFAPAARFRLLAGRPGAGESDRGAIVCACMDVGRNDIVDAIVKRDCRTVAVVGACVSAGTNCGSCRSEIARLIDETNLETAIRGVPQSDGIARQASGISRSSE